MKKRGSEPEDAVSLLQKYYENVLTLSDDDSFSISSDASLSDDDPLGLISAGAADDIVLRDLGAERLAEPRAPQPTPTGSRSGSDSDLDGPRGSPALRPRGNDSVRDIPRLTLAVPKERRKKDRKDKDKDKDKDRKKADPRARKVKSARELGDKIGEKDRQGRGREGKGVKEAPGALSDPHAAPPIARRPKARKKKDRAVALSGSIRLAEFIRDGTDLEESFEISEGAAIRAPRDDGGALRRKRVDSRASHVHALVLNTRFCEPASPSNILLADAQSSYLIKGFERTLMRRPILGASLGKLIERAVYLAAHGAGPAEVEEWLQGSGLVGDDEAAQGDASPSSPSPSSSSSSSLSSLSPGGKSSSGGKSRLGSPLRSSSGGLDAAGKAVSKRSIPRSGSGGIVDGDAVLGTSGERLQSVDMMEAEGVARVAFLDDFLAGYATLLRGCDLLRLVITYGQTMQEVDPDYRDVMLGIFFFLRYWMCQHYEHFFYEADLDNLLNAEVLGKGCKLLVGKRNRVQMRALYGRCRDNYAVMFSQRTRLGFLVMASHSLSQSGGLGDGGLSEAPPMATCWLDMKPQAAAKQLTLLEWRLLHVIEEREWTRRYLKGDKSREETPHINAFVEHVNTFTRWVAWEVIRPPTYEARVAALSFFIQVGHHLMQLSNFNGLMVIVSGLGMSSITRLKPLWERLGSDAMRKLRQMDMLMSISHNFQRYREAIALAPLPIVPHLGVSLQELTFIRDGNPDFLDVPGDTIAEVVNFKKWEMFAKFLRTMRCYQRAEYSKLREKIKFYRFFTHPPEVPSEEKIWELSTKILHCAI